MRFQLRNVGRSAGADASRLLPQLLCRWEALAGLELAARDPERIHRHERAELRAMVGYVRQHLVGEKLEHRLDELRCRRTVGHAARSIRSSSSYSISAAIRPSTAYSTLRSCPFRWRRDWVRQPIAHFT